METDRSLLGESRTSFLFHRECIEEEYENANKFGKQGRKNQNNIPKFTINHQRFCCAIEKISETNAQSLLKPVSATIKMADYALAVQWWKRSSFATERFQRKPFESSELHCPLM